MKTTNKNINVEYKGKKYKIEIIQNESTLIFEYKNGGSICFIKIDSGVKVLVNDNYSNPKMWKKYKNLKGYNGYLLCKEQIDIFMKWFNA